MPFLVRSFTRRDLQTIRTWRYPPPYACYNGKRLTFDARLFFLFRRFFNSPPYEYVAVENEQGDLVGFFQFVLRPGSPAGTITVGLGMRPDLTGQGQGLAFVKAGLAFGQQRYTPTAFRLLVLTWNQRAIKVYLRAGFRIVREVSTS